MPKREARMVSLGYGKFVKADRVYALVPIEADERGDGRRTYVHVDGPHQPIVASRSERAILADVEAALTEAAGVPRRRRRRARRTRRTSSNLADCGSRVAVPLKLCGKSFPEDPMYSYNPGGYFHAGAGALRNIRLALLAAERDTVDSILDFACGGGRVMRYLRAAFPHASLTACDHYPGGVNFCARVFGARPLLSAPRNLGEVELHDSYDLIWVGSLFTHVGEEDWHTLLAAFTGALAEDGVLVFTAYGRNIAEWIRSGRTKLNLYDEHLEQIVRDYDERGFGFFPDFEPENRHGDSLAAPAWVCARLQRYSIAETRAL